MELLSHDGPEQHELMTSFLGAFYQMLRLGEPKWVYSELVSVPQAWIRVKHVKTLRGCHGRQQGLVRLSKPKGYVHYNSK